MSGATAETTSPIAVPDAPATLPTVLPAAETARPAPLRSEPVAETLIQATPSSTSDQTTRPWMAADGTRGVPARRPAIMPPAKRLASEVIAKNIPVPQPAPLALPSSMSSSPSPAVARVNIS